jgi:hypothetical protein
MGKRVVGFLIWFAICGGFIAAGVTWGQPVVVGIGIGAALFGIYGIIMMLTGRVEVRTDEDLQAILIVASLFLTRWYDWLVLLLCLGGGIGLGFALPLGK